MPGSDPSRRIAMPHAESVAGSRTQSRLRRMIYHSVGPGMPSHRPRACETTVWSEMRMGVCLRTAEVRSVCVHGDGRIDSHSIGLGAVPNPSALAAGLE